MPQKLPKKRRSSRCRNSPERYRAVENEVNNLNVHVNVNNLNVNNLNVHVNVSNLNVNNLNVHVNILDS
jgi:hypothetical protein